MQNVASIVNKGHVSNYAASSLKCTHPYPHCHHLAIAEGCAKWILGWLVPGLLFVLLLGWLSVLPLTVHNSQILNFITIRL